MISGRVIKSYDNLEAINKILVSNSIEKITELEDDNIVYILSEDDKIVGVSRVEKYDTYGILKYIVVSEDYRGQKFGDGLLRSAFNYCLRNGIKNIYYHEKNSFLISIGFKSVLPSAAPKIIKEKIPYDEIIKCDLEEFFSRNCKSKGRG